MVHPGGAAGQPVDHLIHNSYDMVINEDKVAACLET